MIVERIKTHNIMNGFWFSTIEFFCMLLVFMFLATAYLIKENYLYSFLTYGLAGNCLPVIVFGVISKIKKEKDIGLRYIFNQKLREKLQQEYPHMLQDTFIIAGTTLIPFLLLFLSLFESIKNKALLVLFSIVISNYIAQVPYAVHLYGTHVNPIGVGMLAFTLLWFLLGFFLITKQNKWGYRLLLAFLITEFFFYLSGEIVTTFVFRVENPIMRFNDMLLWFVFFIGDVNFVVAGYYIYYLIRNRMSILRLGHFISNS